MTDNLPAAAEDNGLGIEGLEDIKATDLTLPRINIDHRDGVYVDSLSNERFETLDLILCGLVKQRVLWDPEIKEESPGPWCRSMDAKMGIPNIEMFPWAASGLEDLNDGEEGLALPCDSCNLKDWGSNPKGETPWCSEQYTFVAVRPMPDEDGSTFYSPFLFTVQRTGIKPAKAYLTSYVKSKQPLYTALTVVKLDHRKRGANPYAVPTFTKGAATDKEDYPEFATTYRDIRTFLTTPRNFEEREETPVTITEKPGDAVVDTTATDTPAADAPTAAAKADDLPF